MPSLSEDAIASMEAPISIKNTVSAYADNLFIPHPHISLPNLLKTLNMFGSISNLKINLTKSEALIFSLPRETVELLRPNFPFRWAQDRITYLSTIISDYLGKIFTVNFPPMLASLRTDFGKWSQGKIILDG